MHGKTECGDSKMGYYATSSETESTDTCTEVPEGEFSVASAKSLFSALAVDNGDGNGNGDGDGNGDGNGEGNGNGDGDGNSVTLSLSHESSVLSDMYSNKEAMGQEDTEGTRALQNIFAPPVTSGYLVFDFWLGSGVCSATETAESNPLYRYGEFALTLGVCTSWKGVFNGALVHHSEIISSCREGEGRVHWSYERWNNTDCSGAPMHNGKLFAQNSCAAVPKNSTDLVSGYATCVASTPASRMLRGQRELASVGTPTVLSLIQVVHQYVKLFLLSPIRLLIFFL
jgi:hypothetical protein